MRAIVLGRHKRCYYHCFAKEQSETQCVNNLLKVTQLVRKEAYYLGPPKPSPVFFSTEPHNLPVIQ